MKNYLIIWLLLCFLGSSSRTNEVFKYVVQPKIADDSTVRSEKAVDSRPVLFAQYHFRWSVAGFRAFGPQPKQFYLENVRNKTKTRRIKNMEVSLLVNESKIKGAHQSRFNSMDCIIDKLKKDSLVVQLINEEIELEYKDHFSTITNNYYQGITNRKFKSVAMKDIYFVNMKSSGKRISSGIGRFIMGASILTILATPFVTASVDEGQKNSVREQVFFAGLSGIAVSVPFFVFGRNKKYGISKEYKTSQKNYWQIVQR